MFTTATTHSAVLPTSVIVRTPSVSETCQEEEEEKKEDEEE